jgi:hypothetical protein
MSAKSKTSLRKGNQNVWYRQERKRHHRSVLGVEPGTAVRANPGSWKKISDPQDLIIFNQARKKCSRFLISQEGRLKSHPSLTSHLHNNLFRETMFSLLQLFRKQENRDYRMESPFQHMPPADTSRVGHLAPCVEFQRLFGVEDPMATRSGTVAIAQTIGIPGHTYWPRGPAPTDSGWSTC